MIIFKNTNELTYIRCWVLCFLHLNYSVGNSHIVSAEGLHSSLHGTVCGAAHTWWVFGSPLCLCLPAEAAVRRAWGAAQGGPRPALLPGLVWKVLLGPGAWQELQGSGRGLQGMSGEWRARVSCLAAPWSLGKHLGPCTLGFPWVRVEDDSTALPPDRSGLRKVPARSSAC